MREADIPPLWLALFALASWAIGRLVPLPLPFGRALGGGLIGAAVVLMGLAAAQMAVHRTTVIPRRRPAALVTGGVFALSRNPIYLADAILLAGLDLWWGASLALVLVPVFMAFITRRYIRAEEAWIGAAFGADYAAYCARTRRWL
ncbi:isoprenylcysteine carboxylmethyltransferase family protein [Sinirhodobacter hankyongi]|uniref:Isoprenylcysteine carboxylmethyltransferase family protein n=1 Tax=Paenirhodobacter hankyongi TaxID=2294033 RepID=A0A421BQ91_9RHOB|nr:isoprenylcysteine carboxylmethyltransferase family protein [Sinirhodobacter hankyongi]